MPLAMFQMFEALPFATVLSVIAVILVLVFFRGVPTPEPALAITVGDRGTISCSSCVGSHARYRRIARRRHYRAYQPGIPISGAGMSKFYTVGKRAAQERFPEVVGIPCCLDRLTQPDASVGHRIIRVQRNLHTLKGHRAATWHRQHQISRLFAASGVIKRVGRVAKSNARVSTLARIERDAHEVAVDALDSRGPAADLPRQR